LNEEKKRVTQRRKGKKEVIDIGFISLADRKEH